MDSIFDLNRLRALLKDFCQLTQLRTVVFDVNRQELLSWPEERPEFCALIRNSKRGCAACLACDSQACDQALRGEQAYIYRCHAGLSEAIMPLIVSRKPVGFLLFGHVFTWDDREIGWHEIEGRCRQYGIDLDELHRATDALPVISREYVESAAHVLQALATYLVMERMAFIREGSFAAELDRWLLDHLGEKITSERMCRELHVGHTKLFKTAKELYGCGMSEHIRALRIEEAKRLLSERSDLSMSEIAEQCGFADYNYFISVFSREVGASPGRYRQQRNRT